MAQGIDVWQIENKELKKIKSNLLNSDRNEPDDLEPWIASNPEIISEDIKIIGRQVKVESGGEIDLLGIDSLGNIIIIELKRDTIPRLALAQAIEYASYVADWEFERLSEECLKYNKINLEDFLSENFENLNLEETPINTNQRLILIGFQIEDSLQKMIEWLFNKHSVFVNAITLRYIKTLGGEELIAKTSIITESVEKQKARVKKFTIPRSDNPGNYSDEDLKSKLSKYLNLERKTSVAIKKVLIPLCLSNIVVTRTMIKEEIGKLKLVNDEGSAGTLLSNISGQMGMEKNDFLRQIIEYGYPTYPWERDNYKLNEKYRDLAQSLI